MQKQKLLITFIFLVATFSAHWALGMHSNSKSSVQAVHIDRDETVADAFADSVENPAVYADDLEDEALILKMEEKQKALEATKAAEGKSQDCKNKCSCKNCKCCKKEQRKQRRSKAHSAKKNKGINANTCDTCNE